MNFGTYKRPQKSVDLPDLTDVKHNKNRRTLRMDRENLRGSNHSNIMPATLENPETSEEFSLIDPYKEDQDIYYYRGSTGRKIKELQRKIKKYNQEHPTNTSVRNVETYLQPVLPQYFKRSDPRYYEAKKLMQRYIDHIDAVNRSIEISHQHGKK